MIDTVNMLFPTEEAETCEWFDYAESWGAKKI